MKQKIIARFKKRNHIFRLSNVFYNENKHRIFQVLSDKFTRNEKTIYWWGIDFNVLQETDKEYILIWKKSE